MTAFECWQEQRDGLLSSLYKQNSMADVVFTIRHALMQTEQNLLASQTDDILRQQLGVLFSFAKNSLAYLETPVTTTAWVPQSRKKTDGSGKKLFFRLFPILLILLCGLFCYFEKLTFGWVLSIAALIAYGLSFLPEKTPAASDDQLHIMLKPDAERLVAVIDGQMRSIDRCINDFTYLNNSLRGEDQSSGTALANKLGDLMEAVYDVDPESREPLDDALQSLLSDMGLTALSYSESNARHFTILPSKNETRTLSPAIVSTEDYRLLRRGTAAVRLEKQ